MALLALQQDALIYAGLFDGAERAGIELAPGRKAYVHVAKGKASVNGKVLEAGDALTTDAGAIEITNGEDAEVLLFDLPA